MHERERDRKTERGRDREADREIDRHRETEIERQREHTCGDKMVTVGVVPQLVPPFL